MRDNSLCTGLHEFAYIMFSIAFGFWSPVVCRGLQHVPPSGGLLIAANHQSLLDPPVLAYALRRAGRRCYFLGKKELFRFGPFGALLRSLGAIPLERRASDVGAMKRALRLLQQGGTLAIFPEGTRVSGGRLERFLPGVGFLALKSGVPVLPGYISEFGRFPAFRSRIEVCFGAPMESSEFSACDVRAAASKILEAVRKVRNQHG